MGFRNPITNAVDPVARDAAQAAADAAAAAQDTASNGIVPGSRLAADAIDGKTITGSTVQTATPGNPRIVLDGLSLRDRVAFWSGAEELFSPIGRAGEMTVGYTAGATSAKDQAFLTLTPPLVGRSGVRPQLIIKGPSRDLSTQASWTYNGTADFAGLTCSTYPSNSSDVLRLVDLDGSGWTNCTTRSPHTFQGSAVAQVRLIGNQVFMRWGWSAAAMTASGVFTVGDVPAGFRPAQDWYFRPGTNSSVADVQGIVYTTGACEVRTGATVPSYALFSTSWLIS